MNNRQMSHIEHHVNNNNMVIIMNAQKLIDEANLNESQKEMLEKIIKKAFSSSNEIMIVRQAVESGDDSKLERLI